GLRYRDSQSDGSRDARFDVFQVKFLPLTRRQRLGRCRREDRATVSEVLWTRSPSGGEPPWKRFPRSEGNRAIARSSGSGFLRAAASSQGGGEGAKRTERDLSSPPVSPSSLLPLHMYMGETNTVLSQRYAYL